MKIYIYISFISSNNVIFFIFFFVFGRGGGEMNIPLIYNVLLIVGQRKDPLLFIYQDRVQ